VQHWMWEGSPRWGGEGGGWGEEESGQGEEEGEQGEEEVGNGRGGWRGEWEVGRGRRKWAGGGLILTKSLNCNCTITMHPSRLKFLSCYEKFTCEYYSSYSKNLYKGTVYFGYR